MGAGPWVVLLTYLSSPPSLAERGAEAALDPDPGPELQAARRCGDHSLRRPSTAGRKHLPCGPEGHADMGSHPDSVPSRLCDPGRVTQLL